MRRTLTDAAVAAFVTQARTYIEPGVNMMEYPEFQYKQLVPVDSSMPEWTQTVQFFSGDMYGKAEFINANSDDVPMAGQTRASKMETVYTAGIGYGYGLEEIEAARMVGRNLPAEDAMAARRAAEEMIDGIAMRGHAEKNLDGLINHRAITPRTADTGDWDTATEEQVLGDINQALSISYQDTKYTSIADTLLVPYPRLTPLASRRLSGTEGNLLSFIQKYNMYTTQTGRPLTIRAVRGLETAGAGGSSRMVAYRRSPEVLKLMMPMPHRFTNVWQSGPFRWDVPGLFRLSGVNIRRPLEVTYIDGI